MAFEEKIKQLLDNREKAKLGGGIKRIDSQHLLLKYSREQIRDTWQKKSAKALVVNWVT